MIRFLRLRRAPVNVGPDPRQVPILQLDADPAQPISIFAANNLSENAKRRLYRTLLPPAVLRERGIDPVSWNGPDGNPAVEIQAEPGSHTLSLNVRAAGEPFLTLEIGDNRINGFDLQFIRLEDPQAERFAVDRDAHGRDTHLGTVRRNLAEEERAMRAGLSPGQVRRGSRGLRATLLQIESFMALMAHSAYSLEPLSYATAWLFERLGFAYARGHALMDEIHGAFQPGGALHRALDASTPFRRSEQARTVRGRAWAIQDGVLAAIDREWGGVRMVKQIGRHAGVATFPEGEF